MSINSSDESPQYASSRCRDPVVSLGGVGLPPSPPNRPYDSRRAWRNGGRGRRRHHRVEESESSEISGPPFTSEDEYGGSFIDEGVEDEYWADAQGGTCSPTQIID